MVINSREERGSTELILSQARHAALAGRPLTAAAAETRLSDSELGKGRRVGHSGQFQSFPSRPPIRAVRTNLRLDGGGIGAAASDVNLTWIGASAWSTMCIAGSWGVVTEGSLAAIEARCDSVVTSVWDDARADVGIS